MYEVLTAPVFQSTHPARGATSALIKDGQNAGISIHAPREGCDQKVLTVLRVAVEISIHAPREGCDEALNAWMGPSAQFQSTHPARGATRQRRYTSNCPVGFQSTHPARGATQEQVTAMEEKLAISIHAPREGCDSKLYQRAGSLLGSICLFAQGEEG